MRFFIFVLGVLLSDNFRFNDKEAADKDTNRIKAFFPVPISSTISYNIGPACGDLTVRKSAHSVSMTGKVTALLK